MKRRFSIVMFVIGVLWSAAAQASFLSSPSFDCNNARTPIERSICEDVNLRIIDGQLGRVYHELRSLSSEASAEQLRQEQRAWLEQRDAACNPYDVSCLLPIFARRIAELNTRVSRLSPVRPSFDCGSANTVMERSICSYRDLRALDGQIVEQYWQVYTSLPDTQAQELEADQIAWSKQRGMSCHPDDLDCLISFYRARMTQLENFSSGKENDAKSGVKFVEVKKIIDFKGKLVKAPVELAKLAGFSGESVKVKRDGEYIPRKKNMSLYVDDVIETGKRSFAVIEYTRGSGALVRMGTDTTIELRNPISGFFQEVGETLVTIFNSTRDFFVEDYYGRREHQGTEFFNEVFPGRPSIITVTNGRITLLPTQSSHWQTRDLWEGTIATMSRERLEDTSDGFVGKEEDITKFRIRIDKNTGYSNEAEAEVRAGWALE